MSTYALSTEERSFLAANSPTYAQILGALNTLTPQGLTSAWNLVFPERPVTEADWGGWVGPSPRVTRPPSDIGLGRQFLTRVTWLWAFPDTPFTRANGRAMLIALQHSATANLRVVSAQFSDVIAVAYSETVNGPLSWWQSGEAGVTRTRDAAPELAGRLDAYENPLGPTTAATHPTTLSEALAKAGGAAATSFTTLALAGAGLVVAAYALPWAVKTAWRAGTGSGKKKPAKK